MAQSGAYASLVAKETKVGHASLRFCCITAIAIAVIGAFVLAGIQDSADQAFSTSAVRLGP